MSRIVRTYERYGKKYHNPPLYDQTAFMITSGSQDAIFAFFENLLPEGDYIIVQEPTHPGFYSTVQPLKARYIAVDYDEEGMLTDDLRHQLSRWKPGSNDRNAPKVMYVNPTGANPSGITYSLRRRQELYKICQEYDIFIFEDDAYYFLPFTEERLPSFLSLDTDGRVLRTDTISKVISPGMRIGIASGPKLLIEKIEKFVHASTQMPPAISQMVLYKLLSQWGDDGFEVHAKKCAIFYKKQRDEILKSAQKWLTGLAEWNVPAGGLFLWMKILGVADVDKMMSTTAIEKGVLTVSGKYCTAHPEIPSPYVRLAYSMISSSDLDKALQRLAVCIKEEQGASAGRTTQ